ncbi:hypothetical protein M758_10G125000 [Ceratodon purpureus]|nr:hypothetical protein M758_10G125000 [Ceratodon purpureus]
MFIVFLLASFVQLLLPVICTCARRGGSSRCSLSSWNQACH